MRIKVENMCNVLENIFKHTGNKVQETVKWAEIWEKSCVVFKDVWNSYYLQ